MQRLIIISVLLATFVSGLAHAKRKAPPKVEPVIYKEVRYTTPNDDGRRAYVQALEMKTNKILWEITVFRNPVNPLAEEDVQHVYIAKMSIREGKLVITAEDNRVFSVDLNTQAVKKLK